VHCDHELLGQGRAVMIMVHGRNAAPGNILDLVPRLDRPALTYLAPAAANNTWYPYSFLEPIERNEPYLSSALRRIAELAYTTIPPADRAALLEIDVRHVLAGNRFVLPRIVLAQGVLKRVEHEEDSILSLKMICRGVSFDDLN
jgi:hypothetical protein